MLYEIPSKTVHKDEERDRGKWSKTLSEVKPVKKSKNLQSFLEIRHKQKEVILSHKLQDHIYK